MPANRRAQSWDVCVWIRPLTIGYDYLGRARGRRKSARRVNRLLGLGLGFAFQGVKMSIFNEPGGVQGWEGDEKGLFGQTFGPNVWKSGIFFSKS